MAALSAIDERAEKVTGVVHLGAIAAPGQAPNHVTFETNTISTYNIFEACPAARHQERGVGVERDGVRHPLPQGSAIRAGRRGDRAAGDRLLAVEADRREDGRAVLPLGPEDEDRRPALLQRHGAARVREFPGVRQGREIALVQPVDLHRRARRRGGRAPGARSEAHRRARLRHRQRQLGDEPVERRTARRGLTRGPSASARSKPNELLISIEKARTGAGLQAEAYRWRKAGEKAGAEIAPRRLPARRPPRPSRASPGAPDRRRSARS